MVLDNVKNLSLYKSLLGDSVEAIENFLKENEVSPKENGTYFLDGADGSKLRANISRYDTKSAEGSFLDHPLPAARAVVYDTYDTRSDGSIQDRPPQELYHRLCALHDRLSGNVLCYP